MGGRAFDGSAKELGYWGRFLEFAMVVGLLWVIELVDWLFFDGGLVRWGIYPRDFGRIYGILFAPLLHDGWGHLIGNSLSLLVLGAGVLISGWRRLWSVVLVSVVVAGVLVWLIGRGGTVHVGASSVVFGFLGYLVAAGFYGRSLVAFGLAVLVVVFYWGSIFGVLPWVGGEGGRISWEGHLGVGGNFGGKVWMGGEILKLGSV